MFKIARPTLLGLAAAGVLLQLSACSPRQLVVRSLADELGTQQLGNETDVDLIRDAAPFHLKLSESVLAKTPGHRKLAEAVASGFTQYAYAFVAFDADRIEERDAQTAEAMRRRAAQLYKRAHGHAVAALELASPGFFARLGKADAADWPRLNKEQVGLAYWAAASWAGWISLSKDDPEVVADLPLAVSLATVAWKTDPAWGEGALTSLMAVLEAGRPGGSLKQALPYFDQAIALGGMRNVGPWVGKAEGYALAMGDRAMFESLLRQALSIRDEADTPHALQNEVMRRRARWLLGRAEDLF